MFSLAYTPAYDPYHTVYRLLVLLLSAENHYLSYRVARAADFFLCFPWALKDVRAPRNVEGFARDRNSLLKSYTQSDYDNFPSARIVFERMEMSQATAVSALAGAEIIDPKEVDRGGLLLIDNNVPATLRSSLQTSTDNMHDLIKFLSTSFPKMEEYGKDGVYARSGLGEFSYDVA